MDAEVLGRVPGPVAVVPLASAPGRDYGRTHARGTGYFRALGADVLDVPDPREHDALEVLSRARLVVLPGGSPTRLHRGLAEAGLVPVLRELLDDGGGVVGSSAGAMLLGSWTVLPEEGMRVVAGSGLAPDVAVVPHWDGRRDDWVAALEAAGATTVLGLPEESGLLLEDGEATALGRKAVRFVRERRDLGVGSRIPMV
jgi:cyanophycinase-like exopeptidase